jgi:YSIRK-targeted surface antigen transcriptional regulator
MDLTDYCELFYASHYLPIAGYSRDGTLRCAFPSPEYVSLVHRSVLPALLKNSPNPGISSLPMLGSYGILTLVHSSEYMLIGPVFSSTITPDILSRFMKETAIDREKETEAAQFLSNIPQYTYNQFLNLLAYLHFSLNGLKISIPDHFKFTDTALKKSIAISQVESSFQAKEAQSQHGTHNFEKQMLDYVRQGETEKLCTFLSATIKNRKLQEGKLADNPLRQAKNLFIGLIAMVGKEAAIKGGFDVEQTYQLIDIYIQECERLQSLDAVKRLQYNMLIDFTERVAQSQLPPGISKEVFSIIQYINNHTNELIGVDDAARYIGKSRAYVAKKFKEELGFNISPFIMHCKLEEAKRLLIYSSKSLVEISSYLCFSSQSYFQNMFKKKYGLTPARYRKQAMQ